MMYKLFKSSSTIITLLIINSILFKGQAYAQTTEPVNCEGATFDMAFVEGGKFEMGSNEGKRDAKPQHTVELNDFYMGQYEVTQEIWTTIMDYNPSERADCPKCPLTDMSWEQLQDFLTKLNECTGRKFRLPTEAEWEYAAQGGPMSKEYKYSGSNNIQEVAWLKDNANEQLHEVGQLKPNELGLYDMNGNAWELCEDWYSADYYKNCPASNPVNTTPDKYRVSRGASWMSPEKYCEHAVRNTDHPHHKRGNGGFRLVMEPE